MKSATLLSTALLVVGSLFFSACLNGTSQPSSHLIPAPPAARMSSELYGIEIDSSMEIIEDKIARNAILSDILSTYEVEWAKIHQIATEQEVFDIRKMRAGNPFAVLKKKGSQQADYFVYEKNKADYVVFDLREDVKVYEGRKNVVTKRREVSGMIYKNMSETFSLNEHYLPLALEMSKILAWTVDFFRLQVGDYYKIIYDEQYVDGEYIGIEKVHAVQFNHMGKDFYAIRFQAEGDTAVHYYDDKGEAMRKAFLKAPLEYTRISSGYSKRRFHPILKRYKSHLGIDYAAPTGTPILAVGDGIVSRARYGKGNGKYVKIRHSKKHQTQYLHLSRFGPGISEGTHVSQGQVIGYVGSTGLATGPHLCFRFWQDGKQVNPLQISIPPAPPIDECLRPQFDHISSLILTELLNIPVIDESGLVACE